MSPTVCYSSGLRRDFPKHAFLSVDTENKDERTNHPIKRRANHAIWLVKHVCQHRKRYWMVALHVFFERELARIGWHWSDQVLRLKYNIVWDQGSDGCWTVSSAYWICVFFLIKVLWRKILISWIIHNIMHSSWALLRSFLYVFFLHVFRDLNEIVNWLTIYLNEREIYLFFLKREVIISFKAMLQGSFWDYPL